MAASRLLSLLAGGVASIPFQPARVHAQGAGVITGTVAGTNAAPLPRARVGVKGTAIAAFTDSIGNFRIFGLAPGFQTIEVRMLGYTPLALPVEVVAGESFHLQLEMSREATVLPDVEINADSIRNPQLQGFRERKARGLGTFFDRQDIAAMQPRLMSDVLRRVPGLRVETAGESYGAGNTIQSGRSAGMGGMRICPVEFYVNGSPMPLPRDGGGINHFIPPEDVVGVEVYTGASQVPPQFNTGALNTRCGVVVIWTRSGPEARPPKAKRRK